MPTLTKLPSGKWRVQVRRKGLYRAATFDRRQAAKDWGATVEGMVATAGAGGLAKPPASTTLADLIDAYREHYTKDYGRTKKQTLDMLRRELGEVRLAVLNSAHLSDFIGRRTRNGAGGVTLAADLSYLSAILKWAKRARHLDVNERLALDARASLPYHGLETRSAKRNREPTDAELERLYDHWRDLERLEIPMETLCRFALATGMRLGEICRLQIEDIDRAARTVVIHDRKDPRVKQGNDQVVPLLPAAWAIAAPLMKDRTEGKLFRINAASASTAFTRACQQLDPPIIDLHFHDLRHRATAQFFRMGLDIPRVALMTGHKTWAQLKRYTDIKPQDVHDALRAKEQHRAGRMPAKRRTTVR